MKTKRFCKSTVSVILALIMLVSMCTVAFVNTSAAETDVAQTGATRYVYLSTTNLTNWSNYYAYFFDSSAVSDAWPGTQMSSYNGNYRVAIPSGAKKVIFNNGSGDQKPEIDLTSTSGAYYWDGSNFQQWAETPSDAGLESGSTSSTTYYLKGSFNNWGSDNVFSGSGTTVSTTITVTAGDYTFKINGSDNSWYSNSGDITDTCSGWTFTTNVGDNCDFKSTSGGTYTFTFDTSTKQLSIALSSSSTDPENPFENPNWTKLAFRDDTSDSIDNGYDTSVFVSFDNGTTKTAMTKVVDTMSGHDMWIIDMPATAPTTVKFYGAKAIDKKCSDPLYTWTATYSGCTTGLYCASSTSAGKWGGTAEPYAVPDKNDINNFSFGIWADIKGNGNAYDAVVARKVSTSEYHLYLPSNTPNPVELYTSFASLELGGVTITDGIAVSLPNEEASYSMTFKQTEYDTSTKTASLKVYRTVSHSDTTNGVATLLLHTERPLFTEMAVDMSDSYKDYKEISTSGSYYMYDEAGNWVNTPKTEDDGSITDRTGLKKIKGRGNSTFEASMKLYGKYAYNINLDETVELIDGAQKSKKWCLLANNVDHSMMRNTFIYSLADDIGLKYSPETCLVNLYNNGDYLGAYVLTEKVEYGKNTLMNDAKSLDKYHEDEKFGDYEDYIEQATGTHNGVSYQYSTGVDGFNYEYADGDESFKEYNYLLEFELQSRYHDEASWFVSPKGQAVVVKYPEFATQKEMKWIIDEFVAAENAVYSKNYDTYKELIDVDSFAKMYLIQELTKNLDSASTSYYIHNDLTTGKLAASPVWDYDWSMGSYYKYKPLYGGSNSYSLDNPEQWFVKNKPMNTDPFNADGSNSVYNFQAQLAQQSAFWEVCQSIWTNDMYAAIDDYVDTDATGTSDGGIIVDEWFESFKSALKMNYARWHSYGSNITSEDWGTKRTRGYKYGSYNFTPGDPSITGTTATDSMDNTIYYLNDWLYKRSKWMNDNGLYNASLIDPYKLNSVTLNATQSGANVTVSVVFDATYDGTQILDRYKGFDLYVGGELEGSYAITDSPVVTLEENVETKIYVVAYLTGDKDKYNLKSDTEKFTYTVTGPEYKVEVVKFDAVQSDDKSTVTIRPSATVTCDGEELTADMKQYTVYLNDEVYATNTFETSSVDVELVYGIVNKIYIKVNPVGVSTVSGTSATQSFSYGVAVEKVNATFNFKASGSTRYQPKIKVNGNDIVSMTKSTSIGTNASGMQEYFWYTATIELEKDVATKVTFTNAYSMNATTTVTVTEAKTLYFGVDNLNQGSVVVDLTEAAEYIRNFKQSASHMVYNDIYDVEVATTSIAGTSYKMGDANGDGETNISDVSQIQRNIALLSTPSKVGAALSDYNLDSVSSIMDATDMQLRLAQGLY